MRLKTFFFPLQTGVDFDFSDKIQEIEKKHKVKAVSVSSVYAPEFINEQGEIINRPTLAVSVLFEPVKPLQVVAQIDHSDL